MPKTARFILVLLMLCSQAPAVRLKEIAAVEGVRSNPLIGYGLVVGLAGTGDKRQTIFPAQSLANLLARMGVTVSSSSLQVKNTAAVLVTADLPAFARPGVPVDVTVAAIGDAPNLQGGLLVSTPLRGADGQVYAVAQGSVITGGFSAGKRGGSVTSNHPTTGRVPNGGTIERAAPTPIPGDEIRLQLREADFTTAARVMAAINAKFPTEFRPVAKAESASLISIRAPKEFEGRSIEFISEVENLQVIQDQVRKIVINERTGTVTVGRDVRIAPVTVLQGGLTVQIQTHESVSQPPPLSGGKTALIKETEVKATADPVKSLSLKDGATVEELVRALTAIGSTPRDIIAILQNLRANGALEAELEVI